MMCLQGYIHRGDRGYTLLQMAMALMIVGIMAIGFMQIYNIYTKQQEIIDTQQSVENAVKKLQTYRQTYGSYPCPAPLDAARTDPTYGHVTNCTDTSQAIGTCSSGYCTQSFARLVDTDNNPLTPPVMTTLRVRIGALPFRELQMDEKDTFDPYGARLTYALTEDMGNTATFNEMRGGIDLIDENGQSLIEPKGSASFLVLSHGENGIGAFSDVTGIQATPCPAFVAGPPPAVYDDTENCVNLTAISTLATFTNSFYRGGGAANFDDYVQYFATAENPLWRRTSLTSEDITDMSDKNIGLGNFSSSSLPGDELTIKQTSVNPTTGKMMTVNSGGESGALRIDDEPRVGLPVQNYKLQADQYCDLSGAKCFQTKDFLGDQALGTGGFKCPANQYMVGIGSNGTNAIPICKDNIRVQCPAGQVMTGLSAGQPVCSTVASSCPASIKSLCGDAISLVVGGNGSTQSFTYTTGGACASVTYTCNSGTWNITSGNYTAAYCTNAPITGQSCGIGYTGTYTTLTCGGGSTFATDCTCVGVAPYNNAISCPAPFTGSTKTQVCQQVCVGNVLQPVSCGPVTGACTCSYADKWDFANCNPGKERTATPTPASFTSPVASWPGSTLMGKYRYLTIDTGTCTYDNPTYDDTNCVCDNKPAYNAVLKTPSDFGLSPSYCYKPKSGSRNVMDGLNLAMSGVTYDNSVTKTPKDAMCNLDTGATTTLDSAVFVPATYKWTRQAGAKSNATVQSSKGGYPEAGDVCDCTTVANQSQACAVAVAGGYDFYTCKCLAAP